MNVTDARLAHNVARVGHLNIPGGGQVVVQGDLAFVGHMKPPHGTSIIDVSDPKNPRLVTTIMLEGEASHTHKVRVAGDLMITNVEQNQRHFLRKAERLPALREKLGAAATDEKLAAELGVKANDIARLDEALANPYGDGGFKIWDISDPAKPTLLHYERTYGFGTHRFDMDENYAYISTEMEGYVGNILVVYDLKEQSRPRQISRWWMPGQHLAGGETPHWQGYSHRLHHTLRDGDRLYAAVWQAGMRVIDVSDITTPKTIGSYNYHPWVVEPTHTVLPVPHEVGGRKIALVADEEHDHRHGQPHAGLWVFDITDVSAITPLSTFHVSELDSPFARADRFGMHQCQEHIEGTIAFCAWFGGGLRVVNFSDPTWPKEVGYFIPEPPPGHAAPQSNDVDVDSRGLVHIIDRNRGFDIVEFNA